MFANPFKKPQTLTSTKPIKADKPRMRRLYDKLGFQKRYNFWLWFVFGGALFGFILARLQYLDINGVFCNPHSASSAAIGECFYYTTSNIGKAGIRMHLYLILPAAFLVTFQFIPVIRHKVILFHRINGYVITVLTLLSNIGALMIVKHAFGGTFATQTGGGALAISTTTGLILAIYNIKKLQIDLHRAWMLRTWFYAGSIITVRIVFILAALIIFRDPSPSYTVVMSCAKLLFIFANSSNALATTYPACALPLSASPASSTTTTIDLTAQAMVPANISGSDPAQAAAALDITFGAAIWISLVLHALWVEIYLYLTPGETNRLRNVSHQRQMEADLERPGYAGFTPQRFGDDNGTVAFDSSAVAAAKNDISTVVNSSVGPEMKGGVLYSEHNQHELLMMRTRPEVKTAGADGGVVARVEERRGSGSEIVESE